MPLIFSRSESLTKNYRISYFDSLLTFQSKLIVSPALICTVTLKLEREVLTPSFVLFAASLVEVSERSTYHG